MYAQSPSSIPEIVSVTDPTPLWTPVRMADHLESRLKADGIQNAPQEVSCIQTDSLVDWGFYFKRPYIQVYDALQILRDRGYDYHLSGIDCPLKFWRALQ